jgi:DNA mismatch repair protein MutH
MKIVTRAVAISNLKKNINKDLRKLALKYNITTYETGKQNKGWKGLILERLAGLETNTSKAPNGLSWELKSVSFYYVKEKLVPKETMAITMINSKELKETDFFNSHCWEKLKAMIFCAVKWNGKNSKDAQLIKVSSLDFSETDDLILEVKEDYDFIRNKLINEGFDALTGKDGKWIQARTKGTGGVNPKTGKRRPITRAFYARKKFVKKIFEIGE